MGRNLHADQDGADQQYDPVISIFSKLGRFASEEVVMISLMYAKCIPVGLLLYGTEACHYIGARQTVLW